MKMEKLQLTPQKYKGPLETATSNYMPIKWTTQKKWTKRFLKRYNLPRLKQEEIENMSRPITSTEIEYVI